MPDSYGHAKDFFNPNLADGSYNQTRGMKQFRNGSHSKPQPDDLVVIGASSRNGYGHLFIVTEVGSDYISFIQQNPGAKNPSRGKYRLSEIKGRWYIEQEAIQGWLRI